MNTKMIKGITASLIALPFHIVAITVFTYLIKGSYRQTSYSVLKGIRS